MRRTLQRFGEFDIVERWSPPLPPLAAQLLFGLACSAVEIAVRSALDLAAPSAGPYALIYPATVLATLYAGWPAGVVTLTTCFLWAWYYVLPAPRTFVFSSPDDAARTLVNAVSATVILVFAEVFRRAVRRAAGERDREIAQRDLWLREIDHRMKNNFAVVASLLDLQRRREASGETRAALAAASTRVQSFAAAHQSLYAAGGGPTEVEMSAYLRTLADQVVAALFLPDRIALEVDLEPLDLPRDQAVSIGLVLNEAVTNAAKHAFGPEDEGVIRVAFRSFGDGWSLVVQDNGRGAPQGLAGSGLGGSLMEAFARRAGGTLVIEPLQPGFSVSLTGAGAA
ncbi:MAG TPA: sensor histidine kinase [Caulobacteraceae bacterium]|nr:sensor histidine kinase [Caulobacteraceae bacterium]